MKVANVPARMPVLCIPHGGGPMPLLDDDWHKSLTAWLKSAAKGLPKPQSILTVSAHWEVKECSVHEQTQSPRDM